MYKQILAQHNIWRLQEMLKSYLKAWEVLCTGLKESKCSPHTLLSTHTEFPTPNWWVPKWQIFVQISTGEKQPWGFFHAAVSCQTLVLVGELSFCFPAQWSWNWKASALADPCYPPPSTCTSTKCSPPGMQQISYRDYRYMWPTRNSWTPVAPLGTAKCCKFPKLPGGRISSLTQHYCGLHQVPVSGTDAIRCFTVDTQGTYWTLKAAP